MTEREYWERKVAEARAEAIDEMQDALLSDWGLSQGEVRKMIERVAKQLKDGGKK